MALGAGVLGTVVLGTSGYPSAGVTTNATINTTDGADSASVSALNWTVAGIAAIDSGDIAAVTASIGSITSASIASADGADNASSFAANWTNSALSLLDGWDAATLTAQTGQTVAGISLQDWPDSALINTSFHVNYILASITVNDYALNTLSMSDFS